MRKFLFLLFVCGLTGLFSANAQVTPKEKGLRSITLDAMKGQIEFLSSDWMEGRATGEKGFALAADYVASMFRVFGVAPAGDQGGFGGRGYIVMRSNERPGPPERTYFQNFNLIETLPGGTSSMTVLKAGREYTFVEGTDYMSGASGRGAAAMGTKFNAPVVFVGYGLTDKEKGIDDFAGIDVKGKVILRMSGYPGMNDRESPMYKKLVGDNPRSAFELTARKNENLDKMGVLGVIDITTGNQDLAKRWGVSAYNTTMAPAETGPRTNWKPMRLDTKDVTATPVSIIATEKIINLLLQDSGIDIAKFEKDAAAGTLKFKPVSLNGVNIAFKSEVNSRRVNVRNVVAMIEGENPNEIVVMGAHLDHMGMDNGKIWNGSDDNASGTVAVMTIAKAFAESGVKPKRTVIFAAWCGEEKGLLGSKYFTQYPTIGKIADYKFYMNFDMIARDEATDTLKNKKTITYTKAFPKLEEISKTNRDQYKVNLKLTFTTAEAPSGGSDYASFSAVKVPVIAWQSTLHPEYHQPSDEVGLTNWNKVVEVTRLGYLQMWDIANGEIK
jgi:hypothetical protein